METATYILMPHVTQKKFAVLKNILNELGFAITSDMSNPDG
jgi:hypothetical protein